jgi:hypothetical protein
MLGEFPLPGSNECKAQSNKLLSFSLLQQTYETAHLSHIILFWPISESGEWTGKLVLDFLIKNTITLSYHRTEDSNAEVFKVIN